MRAAPTVFGAILILVGIGGGIGLSGDGVVEANVPPCTPPLDCDAGVSVETLDLPSAVGWLDIETKVSWSHGSAWIGIIEEGIPDSCQELPTHFKCDENELNFVAGGPDQKEGFTWDAAPGHYRFASGTDTVSSSLAKNEVSYEWSAGLGTTPVLALCLTGVGLLIWAVMSDRD